MKVDRIASVVIQGFSVFIDTMFKLIIQRHSEIESRIDSGKMNGCTYKPNQAVCTNLSQLTLIYVFCQLKVIYPVSVGEHIYTFLSSFWFFLYIYLYLIRGSPHGAVAKVLDCDIRVSEFEHHSGLR